MLCAIKQIDKKMFFAHIDNRHQRSAFICIYNKIGANLCIVIRENNFININGYNIYLFASLLLLPLLIIDLIYTRTIFCLKVKLIEETKRNE